MWYQKGNENDKGAQIDLVIDRRDRIINLVEMKFSDHEFDIDKKLVKIWSTKGSALETLQIQRRFYILLLSQRMDARKTEIWFKVKLFLTTYSAG